jgi:hypothetical protein
VKEKEKGTGGYKVVAWLKTPGASCLVVAWLKAPWAKIWLIVALLMCKRQMSESNLKKVDCCVQSGGDFAHPWRLVRVSTLGDCWGWRVCHFCGLLKCLEC